MRSNTKKASFAPLGIITAGCFIFIGSLYLHYKSILEKREDFKRHLKKNLLTKISESTLEEGSHYIAGTNKEYIYIGNKDEPLELLETTITLKNIKKIKVRIQKANNYTPKNSLIEVSGPNFYIKDGKTPTLLLGKTKKWETYKSIDSVPYFNQAVFISPQSAALLSTATINDSRSNENILAILNLDSNKIEWKRNILEPQIDSLFSTTGLLRYNKKQSLFIYTYIYRNEYIIFDTTAKTISKGKTIDNNTIANINPVTLTPNTYTLASPEATVNINAQTNDNYLYIESNLMGQDEDKSAFKNAVPIDVYNIKKKEYAFSFYIPNYKNNKLTAYKIFGNKLLTIHGQYIVTYEIDPIVLEY